MPNKASEVMHEKHGYTRESLDMLKSEEGQLNAVFACYGSAARHGQMLEVALSDFLVVYNQFAEQHLTKDDLEVDKDKLRKMTMGRLLREVRKHVKFDDTQWVSDCLTSALGKRNFLIHRYFLDREDKFNTETGRLEMLKELVSISNEIEQATAIVGGMRVSLCRALGHGQVQSGDSKVIFSFSIKPDTPDG